MKSLEDFKTDELSSDDMLTVAGGNDDCNGTVSTNWWISPSGLRDIITGDWDDEGCC